MWMWLMVALVGCGDSGGDSAVFTDGLTSPPSGTPGTPTGTATGGATGATTGSATGGATGRSAAEICARWNTDQTYRSEGSWSGSAATCTAGELSTEGIDNTVRQVNLYRWMAGLPEVTADPGQNQIAQECSLMMDANGTIDHYPDASWQCFNQTGADGAGISNLATTASVAAIPLYMVDPGNYSTLGHRRWILSNSLGPIGVGGTMSYSCLVVIGGTGNAGADWVSYPSPGAFPMEAMDLGWADTDTSGWSIQSDTRDFSNATVTVTRGGQQLDVTTEVLLPWYGSQSALAFRPIGWSANAGVYDISIEGAGSPIQYQTELVNCSNY